MEEPAQLRAAMPRSVRVGAKVGDPRNLAPVTHVSLQDIAGTGFPPARCVMGFQSMADDGRQPPDPTAPQPGVGDDDATRVRPALDPRMPLDSRSDATRVHPDRARAAYEDSGRWAGSASVQPARYEPAGYDY